MHNPVLSKKIITDICIPDSTNYKSTASGANNERVSGKEKKKGKCSQLASAAFLIISPGHCGEPALWDLYKWTCKTCGT